MTTAFVEARQPVEGCERLCLELDRAVAGGRDADDVTSRVERALRELLAAGEVSLPEHFREAGDGCYARRLLHHSSSLGYTALAMVWDRDQGTPLHDHCGMWCVECVLDGQMSVTQYELMEERDALYRFEERGTVLAGAGTAGSLVPPFEYHVMHNAAEQPSITIHVYQGEMLECCVFTEQADGWHDHERRRLSYTA